MVAAPEKIAGYAYRYWRRAGMTKWPTVRQAARATGIRQKEIEKCEGDSYMLTGYQRDEPLGEMFVEAQTDDVDRDWCEYWLPYSRHCVCGKHK
jgi:hypothetical protein